MTEEDLKKMELHEMTTDNNHTISRVPGGWLYSLWNTTTFVPEPEAKLTVTGLPISVDVPYNFDEALEEGLI